MRIKGNVFWLPKKGNAESEYEDAASPFEQFDQQDDEFKCAVADGATETSFAGLWAKLLVDGFCSGKKIDELRESWNAEVRKKELAWYAEEKLENGAYAALATLHLKAEENAFVMEATGDCCILHLRNNQLLSSFPMIFSEQFDNSPALLSSLGNEETDAELETFSLRSEWESGDVFCLVSDAIACWALRREEETEDIAEVLKTVKTQADFAALVDEQRAALLPDGLPALKNDDVTLLVVRVST